MQNRAPARRVIQLAADPSPQQADDDQKEARGPDVHGSKQVYGHDASQPRFRAVAREDAVMCGEQRQQEQVRADAGEAADGMRDRPSPDDEVEVRAHGERDDEYRAAGPDEDALGSR